jgi:hypothetical protein
MLLMLVISDLYVVMNEFLFQAVLFTNLNDITLLFKRIRLMPHFIIFAITGPLSYFNFKTQCIIAGIQGVRKIHTLSRFFK